MSPEGLKEALAVTRERLLRAISGVTEEQFKRRPSSPGGGTEWSIAEVLAHLLQSHRLYAGRIRAALDHDGTAITSAPPDAHEEASRIGRAAPVPQLIHGLLAARREIERLIDRAAAEDGMHHAVQHPLHGRQTVEWLLCQKVIDHEREHVEQIEGLRGVVGVDRGREVGP